MYEKRNELIHIHMNEQNVEHVGDIAHNQLLHIQTDENTQRSN